MDREKERHTPGPWRFDRGGDQRVNAERVCVALVTRGVDEDCDENLQGPTFDANAALIAAAPDLLAALKLIESVYRQNVVVSDEPSSVLSAVQAAIAKAEGR